MIMRVWIIGLLFLMLAPIGTQAQQPTVYNLVLEGGGSKGMAYPGAFLELDRLHLLDSLKQIAGTSSGAVNAVLLAIGYNAKEIYHLSYNTKYHRFNQKGFPILGPLFRMKNTYGWYSSERFANTIGDAIEYKTGNREMTFAQLRDSALKYSKYKDLYITGTSLNDQKTLVFSYETFPEMRLMDAVRASATLPFHFETIYMTPSGKIISHKQQNDSTLLVVDGGLLMNYPIHVFDTLCDYGFCKEYLPNAHTLGLRLEEPEEALAEIGRQPHTPLRISSFGGVMQAFYAMSFEQINKQSMAVSDWERTITIDSKQISTKVRKLSTAEKDMLVESGRQAVRLYFDDALSVE